MRVVLYVKEKGRITNAEYQEINEISERTASCDLEKLYKQGILERVGENKSIIFFCKNNFLFDNQKNNSNFASDNDTKNKIMA
jgi:DeoR/GlpR family transcriptional regulator of sugar metabolism